MRPQVPQWTKLMTTEAHRERCSLGAVVVRARRLSAGVCRAAVAGEPGEHLQDLAQEQAHQ
ncbi:hypothetical protein GCM10022379_51120 [Micromonospora maritima]